jgi:hypothetical protein
MKITLDTVSNVLPTSLYLRVPVMIQMEGITNIIFKTLPKFKHINTIFVLFTTLCNQFNNFYGRCSQ